MESNIRPARLRWLVGIHVIAVALAFLFASRMTHWLMFPTVGLFMGQAAALGSYFALRARHGWAWLPLTLAMTLLAAGLMVAWFTFRAGFKSTGVRECFLYAGLLCAVVGVGLGWARRRGWRLIAQHVVGRQTSQVALWQLFEVTLAVSLVLAVRSSLLAEHSDPEIGWASIFVGMAASTLLAVWIALPTGSCWPRFVLASIVVGSLLFQASSVVPADDALPAALLVGSTYAVSLVSLLVVRWSGYRLMRYPDACP